MDNDTIEAVARAYATEIVLSRHRAKADRSEIHPGDVGLDAEGDIYVVLGLINRDAICAAITAHLKALEDKGMVVVPRVSAARICSQ